MLHFVEHQPRKNHAKTGDHKGKKHLQGRRGNINKLAYLILF
jgi:hypothetical protein